MTERELIQYLAQHDPMNQDEMGGCVWCASGPPGERYGYAGRYVEDHKADCPWLLARFYLGDALPESRTTESDAIAALAEGKGGE